MIPTKAPFKSPFFLILLFPIELPINMLIAVAVIINGLMTLSLMLENVNTAENMSNNISVIAKAIPIPLNMLAKKLFSVT